MALSWGIVSAGKISHDFVTAISTLPAGRQEVAAVAARNLDRAKTFAKLHNIKKAYGSYEALANDKSITIAYIGVLNPQHYELAKLMLENGKHVLCEKPLCLNYKQAKLLIDLARSKKLFLMEAVWSRMFPAYDKLQQEIESGNLGEVLYVTASLGQKLDEVERLNKKELGGSAILDLGVYVLQFAQFIFKEKPINITSGGFLNDEEVDVSSSSVLTYSGGKTAVLSIHSKAKLPNTAIIVGTKGTITIPNFWCPEQLQLTDGKWLKWSLPTAKLPFNFENSAGLAYEAEEVRKCIEAGLTESPKVTHEDSLTLATLEDTIRMQLGVHTDINQ